jgi:hypothetical protein
VAASIFSHINVTRFARAGQGVTSRQQLCTIGVLDQQRDLIAVHVVVRARRDERIEKAPLVKVKLLQ